jgi:hypothetical protein
LVTWLADLVVSLGIGAMRSAPFAAQALNPGRVVTRFMAAVQR